MPFQRTIEPATKFDPLTVSVNEGPPAVADTGFRLRIEGTGLGVLTTLRICEFDVPPPGAGVKTVIVNAPTEATSEARICAVNCEPLTKPVDRGDPFTRTTEVGTKFAPLAVNVNPAPIVAVVGFKLVKTGAGGGPEMIPKLT